MDTRQNITNDWQDSVNVLLGIALFISPWALNYAADTNAALNAHIVGAVIALLALAALFAFRVWEEWISAVLGAWLIIAPWVLGFSGNATATRTSVVIGIAAIVLSLWSANEHASGHLSA
ncbi:SPW repeat protein [Hyphomicrobium sp.]|uniref:SPW repeat protein n=1 Tax=Hyphomicrobium sp. TaxID=82 RepID=UPI001DFDBDC9|nr:SPW repeat protein [Hyphomicrobium sp.]MBY0561402.1 SPW repeat protein [Hyphomicrobium sp.]